MTPAAQGVYRNLCDAAWLAQPLCTLPNDDRFLWKLGGCPSLEYWLILKGEVFSGADGWALTTENEWAHRVVIEVYKKCLENHLKKAASGRMGGRAKQANLASLEHRSSDALAPVKHKEKEKENNNVGKTRDSVTTNVLGANPADSPTLFGAAAGNGNSNGNGLHGQSTNFQDEAEKVTSLYFGNFNAVFGRNLRYTGKHVERVRARLKDKFRPWHIVALPILVDAQGIPGDMRRTMDPSVPLRDGRHARTMGDGKTGGATDWLERAMGRIDRTTLTAAHVKIATESGVIAELRNSGVALPGNAS